MLITALISLITSFVGSFLCFILWVHFDLEERWQARKEVHELRELRRGFDLEQQERYRLGLRPLPETERGLRAPRKDFIDLCQEAVQRDLPNHPD